MRTQRTVTAVLTLGMLGLFLGARPAAAQETAEELYQAALYQEEVQGNLERAIDLYERIVADFPSSRPVAANALLHIGLCHEKLGNQDAQRAYRRLLRDYADQSAVADRARVRLASLQGLARTDAPPSAASGAGIVVRHLFGGDPADIVDGATPFPDGRRLVGVGWGATASNIVVRDLVTGSSHALTEHPDYDEGMALGAWPSPDGNAVAYPWLNEDESAEVRLAFRDGSLARTLCAQPDHFFWPGPWRHDGRSLMVTRNASEGQVEWGWVTPEGCVLDVFETVPDTQRQSGRDRLSLSSDDRYVAFDFAVAEDSERRDISMIPAVGGPPIPIVEHPANDRAVGWVPGTDHFLFVSDRGGKSDLYAIEVSNGEVRGHPRLLQRDVGEMRPTGFSRDGELFYEVYTLRAFISVAPFDPETGSVAVGAARPLLGSKAEPDWSPDGRSLTYWHMKYPPSGPGDFAQVLGVTDVDTGEERELAVHLEVDHPRWSMDGRSILAKAVDRGRGRTEAPGLFEIDPRSGEASEVLRLPSPPDPDWYWSIGMAQAPNGRDIVYVRDGRLMLHQAASGEAREIFRHPGITSGLLEPSRDGRRLLFGVADSSGSRLQTGTVSDLRHGRGTLLVASLPDGGIRELLSLDLEPGTTVRNVDWGPEGRYVYFTETSEDRGTLLKRVSVEGGEPEVVWTSRDAIHDFTISPTGDRVAFTIGENHTDVYVMENLRSALRPEVSGR